MKELREGPGRKEAILCVILCLFVLPGWMISVLVDPAFPTNYRTYLFILVFVSGPPFFISWILLRKQHRMLGLYLVPAGTLLRMLVLTLIFFSFEGELRNRAMVVFLIGIGSFLLFEVASALGVGLFGRG